MISDSGQQQKDKCCMNPLMSSWSHQIKTESGVEGTVSEGLQSGVMLCKQTVVMAAQWSECPS